MDTDMDTVDSWDMGSNLNTLAPPPAPSPVDHSYTPDDLTTYTLLLTACFDTLPPSLPGTDAGPPCLDSSAGRQVTFCVPGFKEGQRQLDWRNFEFPGLRLCKTADALVPTWWCTCSAPLTLNHALFAGRDITTTASSQVSSSAAPACLHIDAVLQLAVRSQLKDMRELLAHTLSRLQPVLRVTPRGTTVYSLVFSHSAVQTFLVSGAPPRRGGDEQERVPAVVFQPCGGSSWHCSQCFNHNGKRCYHILAACGADDSTSPAPGGLSEQQLDSVVQKWLDPASGARKLSGLSSRAFSVPVPPPPPPPPPPAPSSPPSSFAAPLGAGHRGFPAVLRPQSMDVACTCGNDWTSATEVLVDALIFCVAQPWSVLVVRLDCACGRQLHYDGAEHRLVNMSDRELYSHDLLSFYSETMWRTRMPFRALWDTVCGVYASNGVAQDVLRRITNKRGQFEHAWLDYITLQQLDYANVLRCVCPNGPQRLVADGTHIGFAVSASRLVQPWAAIRRSSSSWTSLDSLHGLVLGSLFRDRCLVRDPKLRKRLRAFARDGLPSARHTELLTALQKAGSPANALLPFVAEFQGSAAHHATSTHAELLSCLGSTSPACAILPPQAEAAVEEFLQLGGCSPANDRAWAEHAPVLHSWWSRACGGRGGGGLEAVRALLGVLLLASRAAFIPATNAAAASLRRRAATRAPRYVDEYADTESAGEAGEEGSELSDADNIMPPAWGVEESLLRTGHYFPHLPPLRRLRDYVSDRFSQQTGPSCTKFKTRHKTLTPGLLTFFCLDCRHCIGFSAMASAESPRHVFEVLYTRFPSAPSLFVYDNNCHGHAYCLNREPAFFEHTHFVIDKTHFVGHTGCCRAYDIARYATLKHLNSQLCEQKNSRLALIKTQAGFMSQPVFLFYVRYFLFRLNKEEE